MKFTKNEKETLKLLLKNSKTFYEAINSLGEQTPKKPDEQTREFFEIQNFKRGLR